MLLRKDDHVLFFGDSITDAGCREKHNHNDHLGTGYAAVVAAVLSARYPELALKFTNQGFSGNRICDLEKRFQADVIDAKPTVVSILTGINDTWHRFSRNLDSPLDQFQASYRRICTRIRQELGARLVVCEPFLLQVSPEQAGWRADLDPRIHAVRQMGAEFASAYVPLDGLFAAAACKRPAATWAADGVHPTFAGHGLIAEAWIQAVCG